MTRGIAINDRLRHLVIMEYASTNNKAEVARTFGIPQTTVGKIIKENPEYVESCRQKAIDVFTDESLSFREEFMRKAESSINMAIDLSQQRIELSLAAYSKYDSIINDMLKAMREGGVDLYAINDMLKSLSAIMSIPLKDLSTYVGTLYDKRALASGGITNKTEIVGGEKNANQYEVEQALTLDEESKDLLKQLYRRSRNIQETS